MNSNMAPTHLPLFSVANVPGYSGLQIVHTDEHQTEVQKVEDLSLVPPNLLHMLRWAANGYRPLQMASCYGERPFEALYEGQTKYDPLCILKPSSPPLAPAPPPLGPYQGLLPSHSTDFFGKHTIEHPYIDQYLSRRHLTRPRAWVSAERQDALLDALAAVKVLYVPSHPKYTHFWPRDDEGKRDTIERMVYVANSSYSPIYLAPSHLPKPSSLLIDVSNFVRQHYEDRSSSESSHARHPTSRPHVHISTHLRYSSSSSHPSHICTHAIPSKAVYDHLQTVNSDSSHYLPYLRQECTVLDKKMTEEKATRVKKTQHELAEGKRETKRDQRQKMKTKKKEEKETEARWERTIKAVKAQREADGWVVDEEELRWDLEGYLYAEMSDGDLEAEGDETEDEVQEEEMEVEEVEAPEAPVASSSRPSKRKREPVQPKIVKAPLPAKPKGKGKKNVQAVQSAAPDEVIATTTTPAVDSPPSPARPVLPLPKRKSAPKAKKAAPSNAAAAANPAPEDQPPSVKHRKTGTKSATNDASATRKSPRGTHGRSASNETNESGHTLLTSDTAVNLNGVDAEAAKADEGQTERPDVDIDDGHAEQALLGPQPPFAQPPVKIRITKERIQSLTATPSRPPVTLQTPLPGSSALPLPQIESREDKVSLLQEVQAPEEAGVVKNDSATKGKGRKRKAGTTAAAMRVSKRKRVVEPEPEPVPETAADVNVNIDAETMDVDIEGESQALPTHETDAMLVADEQSGPRPKKRTRKPLTKAVEAATVNRATAGGRGATRGRAAKSRR